MGCIVPWVLGSQRSHVLPGKKKYEVLFENRVLENDPVSVDG